MVLSWKSGGILLGLVFLAAVALVKPIGVSTQFVIVDGILWNAVDPSIVTPAPGDEADFASTNAYLNKSGGAYAEEVAKPLNYGLVFVLAIIAGAGLSALVRGGVPRADRTMPAIWRANFGDAAWKRYVASFGAGFVVLYGARLAGGCTSGHMMSGMMQTALSGYIFAAGVFVVGIPAAIALFRREA
ncbi:YeeE/YedE family protein [Aurantimonas sp. VKM B-3413]|nr:YeeE/YedE thiosulfate transporter family protein [Aurantimonas sp. VKM B-3413]MCB8840171.1 YeeE/YedE family protein [Aurantimonas sp. VKM B-3413]